jgi:hypothetical protein
MYLYVAAATQVVSAVIMVERIEKGHALPVQRPVYYISEELSETKALPADPKVALHGSARAVQASPLLRGSSGHGSLLLSVSIELHAR